MSVPAQSMMAARETSPPTGLAEAPSTGAGAATSQTVVSQHASALQVSELKPCVQEHQEQAASNESIQSDNFIRIGAERMQSMEDGAILYRAANGRPVMLNRTAVSVRRRLKQFTETCSVEIGCQIRACPESRRDWHIENLALAIEKTQPNSMLTLKLLEQMIRQAHGRPGRFTGACNWRINHGLSMDLDDFYEWMRKQERKVLLEQTLQWVATTRPQQKYRAAQIITVPLHYGFSVGFIADVVPKTAVYRVRQVCNGKPLPGSSIEVFFEHASDPPADPLVHQLRLEADNSFCLQANPTAKPPG